MRSDELRVQKFVPSFDQARDEVDEGNLAGVALAAEHAFAEERRTERNSVEAAGEPAIPPAFDRVRATARVQGRVQAQDFVVDPGLFAIRCRFRARVHHRGEGEIRGHCEAVAPHRSGEALGDVKSIQRNDPAPLGGNPIELVRVAALGHREYALRIGAKQDIRCERRRTVHLASIIESGALLQVFRIGVPFPILECQRRHALTGGGEYRRHWSDTAFALAALFVSAVSLWVGIRTEDANEKLVAASTWPYLQVESSNADSSGRRVILMDVVNGGVGPAKVEAFEVFWKGKPYRSGIDLVRDCCGYKPFNFADVAVDRPDRTPVIMGGVQGTVIRAGETRTFVTVPLADDNQAVWRALNIARGKLEFRICYCSVLNECWRSTFGGIRPLASQLHPEHLTACPVPKVAFVQ
jgi:hypothetical protein